MSELINRYLENINLSECKSILKNLYEKETFKKDIEKELQKVLTEEKINEKFESSMTKNIDKLDDSFYELGVFIETHNYGQSESDSYIGDFYDELTLTLETNLPLFYERKMYKEALKFVISCINTMKDEYMPSWIVDVNTEYNDAAPFCREVIEKGKLNKKEGEDFIDKYLYNSKIDPIELFMSKAFYF